MKQSNEKIIVLYHRYAHEVKQDKADIEIQSLCKLAEKQGYTIDKVFLDNGYSGLNFNHPSFIQLKKRIESQ